MENITDFPVEILEKIWFYCDEKSLHNFVECSKICYELAAPTVFKHITISAKQMRKTELISPGNCLQFTRHFKVFNWSSQNRNDLHQNFKTIIGFCAPSQLNNFTFQIPFYHETVIEEDLGLVFIKYFNLKGIRLFDVNKFTSLTLKNLSSLNLLFDLRLHQCQVSVENFSILIGLAVLHFRQCKGISENCIDDICTMDGLRKLVLSGNYESSGCKTSISAQNIARLTSLEYLDISWSKVNCDDLMNMIESLQSLRILNLSHIGLTRLVMNELIEQISYLPLLTHLSLSTCEMGDGHLEHLRKTKLLQYLNISGNRITDVGLQFIGQMVSLKELNLASTSITDAGISLLSSLVALRFLDVQWCLQLTDGCMGLLNKMPSLKKILKRTLNEHWMPD